MLCAQRFSALSAHCLWPIFFFGQSAIRSPLLLRDEALRRIGVGRPFCAKQDALRSFSEGGPSCERIADCCAPIRNPVCSVTPARRALRLRRSGRVYCRRRRRFSMLRRNSAEVIRPLLFQSKDTAAYYTAVDFDVHSIGAHAECTRAQIVCVLTASNSEV